MRGVLDYGCGRGADLSYFRSLGIDAVGYDPHEPFGFAEPPAGLFMVVTLIFVLNVLPTVEGSAGGHAWGRGTFGTEGRAIRGDAILGGRPTRGGPQWLAGLGGRVHLTPRHLPARHRHRGDRQPGRDARPAVPMATPGRTRRIPRGARATNADDGEGVAAYRDRVTGREADFRRCTHPAPAGVGRPHPWHSARPRSPAPMIPWSPNDHGVSER
ncbi:MAG: methyltransferase domain-containing protein [Solirubrobacteraceae bacterium]